MKSLEDQLLQHHILMDRNDRQASFCVFQNASPNRERSSRRGKKSIRSNGSKNLKSEQNMSAVDRLSQEQSLASENCFYEGVAGRSPVWHLARSIVRFDRHPVKKFRPSQKKWIFLR
jgi:hypothetical protein